jgi:TetR/AcrR family transcriptional repressor of bet genes
MAHITENAGLSRGIVNFHFESKESLYVETLRYMADEYAKHWQKALNKAGEEAAPRLRSLIVADFAPDVSSRRKIATWIAFRAEAVSNAVYQELCWTRDDAFLQAIRSSCTKMKVEAGYEFSPTRIASAIYAMQEGLWLRLLLERKEMRRETAIATALGIIAPVFPKHFNPDGSLLQIGKIKP